MVSKVIWGLIMSSSINRHSSLPQLSQLVGLLCQKAAVREREHGVVTIHSHACRLLQFTVSRTRLLVFFLEQGSEVSRAGARLYPVTSREARPEREFFKKRKHMQNDSLYLFEPIKKGWGILCHIYLFLYLLSGYRVGTGKRRNCRVGYEQGPARP